LIVGNKVNYDISNSDIPKDSKEDNKYQKSFNVFLTIIVRDKDGKVIKKYKQKSHSPTSNFIGMMLPLTYYNTTGSSWEMIIDSTHTYNYYQSLTGNFFGIGYPNSNISVAGSLLNILVGNGLLSNPYNAYNLASPISNGSGAGQLVYGSITFPSGITISSNKAYFIVSQSYTNSSGYTITITEVGIYVSFSPNASTITPGAFINILTWYDTLSSPISLSNGQSATIYYTFSVNA
jgi:hypothetical protein